MSGRQPPPPTARAQMPATPGLQARVPGLGPVWPSRAVLRGRELGMLSAVGALAESEKRPWALQRRGRGTPLPSCPSLPALAVSGSLGTPASLFSTGVTSQAVFQVLWCPILTTFPSVGVKDVSPATSQGTCSATANRTAFKVRCGSGRQGRPRASAPPAAGHSHPLICRPQISKQPPRGAPWPSGACRYRSKASSPPAPAGPHRCSPEALPSSTILGQGGNRLRK